jgi:hypothetical protein
VRRLWRKKGERVKRKSYNESKPDLRGRGIRSRNCKRRMSRLGGGSVAEQWFVRALNCFAVRKYGTSPNTIHVTEETYEMPIEVISVEYDSAQPEIVRAYSIDTGRGRGTGVDVNTKEAQCSQSYRSMEALWPKADLQSRDELRRSFCSMSLRPLCRISHSSMSTCRGCASSTCQDGFFCGAW